ncbi:MAG: ATP-binding protein [Pseudochelatococcus sp.]|jgi:signal transduction histidine kinase|uniref:ATP-binding protein n=1 Tax=Pseudochelatococcus sp. TaxID=2020869 RepID=UPI003D8D9F1D
MMSAPLILGVSFGYLLLLFAVAAFADRRAAAGRSVIDNAPVYALSLGVYCTAWTYFGSVGQAASAGVWFLPTYLGPMLAMLLAGVVILRMVRIARTYRITSIADFIASRYGKSPLLAALVTLITVVGIVPYIALQLEAISTGYMLMTGAATGHASAVWWQDTTLYVALALAAFTIVFGTRHLDSAERHEGMVAAIAFESLVKLAAFLAVGFFVTWGVFAGPADIWAQAAALPQLQALGRLGDGTGAGGFAHAQWFALVLLAMMSVLLLPRQFQMMVVECVDERHLRRAAWVFPAYLFLINIFVLPIAIGGEVYFGPGEMDPETFVLMLPVAEGARLLAVLVYIGGFSAATGMLIVETIAVSTMICNDFVMPALFRWLGLRRAGNLTGLLLNIRRVAIVGILLLGYCYFRIAGETYALVSIGLISFAAVAQFAPALFGGLFWKGGTRAGALAGLAGGFLLWAYTLMLPSVARSGWFAADFVTHGPFGIGLLAPERLFGLAGLDNLTHALFWSLTVNAGLYVGLSLWRAPSVREASQALLFVDIMKRGGDGGEAPVFWRGRARIADLQALTIRVLGEERGRLLFAGAREDAAASPLADARLVDRVERQLAGAVGSASARVMVASVVEEEALDLDDMIAILDEATELRAANEKLRSLDQMKDDFISSVSHELRTPLTSIRALSELMRDTPDMDEAQRAEFLRIVVAESERLGRLVNQVLDMAKIESGQAEWHNSDVDLRALILAAIAGMAAVFAARGTEVATDLPAEAPLIRADPDRLTQVLLNLLSNAAKFVPEDGGRIVVSLAVTGAALEVRVRDNGPGVPPADQPYVFERFRQGGDALTRPAGTGLGLPISRRIVNHLGGDMWLESKPGEGACFGFRLPLAPGPGREKQ